MTLASQKTAALLAPSPQPGSVRVSAALKPQPVLPARQRLTRAVTEHSGLVWRSLRRFGVPERDVDDAAQQVYLALSQRLADVEAGKEAGFLVAVAVRVAANTRRKRERSPEVLSDELDLAEAPHTPEALLHEKQLRQQLDQGLATLSFEQRTVFVLFELEGFSLPEIADALQLPLGTATSRLRRARDHFEAWAAARPTDDGEVP